MSAPMQMTPELEALYVALQEYLRGLESVIVAFSGGIDSSLVAYLAKLVLPGKVLMVTSASASLKRDDLELTRQLATQWEVPHRIIETRELERPEYASNPHNRCYYCKTTLYQELEEILRETGFRHVVNGTNLDDLSDYRPGLQAAQEHQVRSPLAECGLRKSDVRMLAAFLGLPNAQKPQAACLASRIPYGNPVSREVLAQIERAENVLARLGFTQFRVRHHEKLARLELLPSEFLLAFQYATEIQQRLKNCGYDYITLDLGGFRSGSFNESWRPNQGLRTPEPLSFESVLSST